MGSESSISLVSLAFLSKIYSCVPSKFSPYKNKNARIVADFNTPCYSTPLFGIWRDCPPLKCFYFSFCSSISISKKKY